MIIRKSHRPACLTTVSCSVPGRRPWALVGAALLVTAAMWSAPLAAQTLGHATGGSGGSSNGGAGGGAGGDAGQSGIAGMDGTVGAGGDGGAAGAMGSPGTPGGDGGDGGAGHDDGGGGGGGGGGHGGTLTTSPSANMTGGNGGSGGAGDYFNDGGRGGGGGGGDGALITQTATVAIDTNITLQGGDGGPGNPGVGIGIGGGGGGGGAGLYVSGSDTVADVTVAGIISGGDGGVSDIHGGGFGGDGGAGAGVVVTDGADLSLQLSSHIGGGIGGSGSYAGNSGDGVVSSVGSNVDITLDTGAEIVGGDGHGLGDGGAGLRLAGGGQVTNHGTIRGGNAGGSVTGGYFVVRGGQGSGGAAGGDGAARAAAAGAGIVGQNLTIINDGTIAGGARANAITFIGGANVLWLQDGSVINGIVDATAGSQDQLMLGDISSGSVVESTFDVDQLGPAGQFRGFEQYWAVGNSIVTLTGTTTEVTPWTIDSGAILSIAADASLGDASGDLLLRYGGVLQVTGVANETTARNIGIYQQGLIDIANADNNFTVTGAISDYDPPGSTGPQGSMLLKAGAGTLTLAGNNTYTGGTWVGGGTLDITAGSSAGPLASAGAPSSGVIHLAGGTTLHNAGTISSVEYDGSLGQPADALEAVTVGNSGSIVGGGNGTGKIIALLNGDITNSGNISTTTPTVMGSGAVQLTGEGSIDNTGTISSTPYSRAVLLGSGSSTSLPITGSIDLANRAGGVIEGGIGVAVNQMVALVSGGGGTTYANRPISITNDGGTIRGSLVGVELLTGGTIINRAGSTIEYTGTATDPCADFFSAGMPASGSCAIHAPDAAALGTPPGVTIAPTVLTNAGSIVGDVQLGDGLANDVTLVAGGSIDGDLDIGTSSDALLTLKGGAGTTQAWSQAVTGSTTFAGSLIKSGAGIWVLDNAALADVTGTTQLQAGSLIVGGSAGDSGELGGNVAVASAATLGGHGSIAGNVTVADGGHIAPGNSVGVLDVAGDLLLNGGSILDFELGSPGSSADPASGVSDRIDVAGDLTLDGTLNLAQSTDSTDGSAGLGYYRLLTYGGTLTDNGLEVGTTPTIAGGGSFDIQAGSGNVDLFIASLGDDTLQHWQGGDGTWNSTDTQWLNKNSTVPVTWAGNHAVFKNDPGGFSGGIVAVNGTQTFKGLQFVDNGYQLQGPGTLQVDGTDRTDGNAEIRVLAGTTAQIATTIAGSGGITKTQGGTLVLSGNNTYSGGTSVNDGVLSVSSDANLGAASGALTLNGGTLQNTAAFTLARDLVLGTAGGTLQTDADLTVANAITGNGTLTQDGSGALILQGSVTTHGAQTYNGTVMASSAIALTSNGGDITQGSDGEFHLSGTSSFDAGAGDITLTNGNNDFQGAVSATGASVSIRDANSLSVANLTSTANGNISLNAGGALSITGGMDADTGGIDLTATGAGLVSGYITGGAISLNASDGTLLTGTLASASAVTLTAGELQVGDGGSTGTLTGDVINHSGLAFNRSDDLAYAGVISGNGTLKQTGAGALTLNGASDGFTGTTTVQSGGLIVGGSAGSNAALGGTINVGTGAMLGGSGTVGTVTVADGGHIAPGNSVGVLDVAGDLMLNGGSILDFELGSPGANAASGVSDRIDVAGDLTLDGTLNLAQSTDGADGTAGFGYYRLLTYGGTLTDNGLEVGATPTLAAGAGAYEVQAGGGNVDLFIASLGDDTLQHWQGGDGAWNATNVQWLNQGSDVPVAWAGNHAVFKNEPGGFSGGTVTVDGTQSFKGLQFVDNGYRLEGNGTLQIDGSDRADGNAEIRVLAGTTAEIATTVAGSGGVTKTQAGTLILSGNNTYGGGTSITGGTLEIAAGGTVGTGSVVVDDGAGQSATLKVDAGVSLGNQVLLSNNGLLDNAGSLINTSDIAAITTAGSAGQVNNHGGGSIEGASFGVLLFDGGDVTNSGAGSEIRANGTDGWAVTIGDSAGTLVNTDQARIEGVQVGVALGSGGEVGNTGGASISAGQVGVMLLKGGTVTNGAGSTIETTGTAAGDCNTTGDCAILVSTVSADHGGALTLVNAGQIIGNVQMDEAAANDTLLQAGGSIQGDLLMGGNAASTLTLDGNNGSPQRYSDAVTGTTTFAGTLTKNGSGTWIIDNDGLSNATGAAIASGALIVGGTPDDGAVLGGDVTVDAGALLGGHGTINGDVTNAGTLAPGNSIGTLNVGGDITFAAGSTYRVEVDPASSDSDLVHASGTATLNGGSVVHIGENGTYRPDSSYTILTADGGISGTFADVASNFAFLDSTLVYDPNSVVLQLMRNDINFCMAGMTANQCATGNGAESTGAGSPIYNAIAGLSAEQARDAFDQLSGEIHASTQSALLDDSHFVRGAINDRLLGAAGHAASTAQVAMAYDDQGEQQLAPANADGFVVWEQAFGSWASIDGDGNAAKLGHDTGGFFIGADAPLGSAWRLGAVAGYSHSSFSADARASSTSSRNYHLGLYSGRQWGALGLRFGGAYTWHDIEASRSVAFRGFSDRPTADYHAGTAQAFGELGYTIELGDVAVEPFANLAYVNLHSNGFSEKGGDAALSVDNATTDATFTTIGSRISSSLDVGGIKVTAQGSLGWQHAVGDTTPHSRHAFNGGDDFTIAGVPIAEDAAIIEAGVGLDLAPNTTLGVAYQGQLADGARQNGAKVRLEVRF